MQGINYFDICKYLFCNTEFSILSLPSQTNKMSLLVKLYDFVLSMRRSGTSSFIKKIASENDVYILVATIEEKKEFGKNAISFGELDKMKGKPPKPILIDNHAMLVGCNDLFTERQKLREQIKDRNELIEGIKNSIDIFERKHGKFNLNG